MVDTDRIGTRQVYDAVIEMRGTLNNLCVTVQKNCTDIALLQQRGANHSVEEVKRDQQYENLDEAVQAMRLSQAKSAAIGAVVAALIVAIPQLIQALR